MKSGKNELEIRVTDLWGNRFIGDEQYPDDIGFGSSGVLGTLPDWFVKTSPVHNPDARLSRRVVIMLKTIRSSRQGCSARFR